MDTPTQAGARDHRLLRSFARRIDPTDPGAHNNLGVLYYNAGLHEDAVAAFMRAVELDPRMDVARRNFEVACLACGRADQRVAELRERLRLHPNDRDARWEMGRLCALLGEHGEAIAQFNELLRAHPGDLGALIQLGLSHKALGAIDDAFACFQRALSSDPDSSLLYFYLAEIEYNRGGNEQAIEFLKAAIKRNDKNHEAWYLLSFALGDAGRHEQAKKAADKALQINPELGRAHANLALVADPTARYVDKAMRDAQRGAHLDTSADAQLAHVTLGLAYRNRGYYAEALTEYEQALAQGEDLDLAQQAIAELHLLRRDGERALAMYDALLSRHARYPKLWNERGVALVHCGRFTEALESYQQALTVDPRYPHALNNAGVARAHAGDRDGALSFFVRALETDPTFAKPRLNQALLLYRGKRFQQAIEAYRAVLTAGDETNAVAWNGIGLVLAELGRHEEARAAFARAIESRPRYAEARYNLSFTLSNLGDVEGALRENNLAIEIEPYYVQQKFELAVDLEFEDPAIAVDAEPVNERQDENIQSFAFDARVLDSLFTELAPAAPAGVAPVHAADAYAMAEDFLSKGFTDRAHAEILRAIRAGADPVRGGTLLGNLFAGQGLWGEALERYRDVRLIAPEAVPAMVGEANALLRLGKSADARALAEVVARRDSNPDVFVLLGDAREAQADLHGALMALRTARAAAPTRPAILTRIGDVARRLHDAAGADEAYREALALDSSNVKARLGLARIHCDAGRRNEARRELEAALSVDPANAQVVLELSALHRKDGRSRDALMLLIALIEREIYHFDALMALGDTLFEARQPADALVAYHRVVRFDPGHLPARRAIKRVMESDPGLAPTGTSGRAGRWQ